MTINVTLFERVSHKWSLHRVIFLGSHRNDYSKKNFQSWKINMSPLKAQVNI